MVLSMFIWLVAMLVFISDQNWSPQGGSSTFAKEISWHDFCPLANLSRYFQEDMSLSIRFLWIRLQTYLWSIDLSRTQFTCHLLQTKHFGWGFYGSVCRHIFDQLICLPLLSRTQFTSHLLQTKHFGSGFYGSGCRHIFDQLICPPLLSRTQFTSHLLQTKHFGWH